ncbi:MAG: apolipoprotein N-acyltransferase [Pseudomonadales bacterium]
MSYLFALVTGALLPLSLAPFNLWPLGLVAVGLWFWTLVRGVGRDWLLGWWFGVGKYAVGASWVYVSIHTYGQASAPLAAGLVALFVAFVAGFAVLNALIFARVRTGNVAADALSFAVVFVLSEWVLTWLLTGFPWLYLGHGHLGTVLSGWAPVGGVFLVSLAAALFAAASVAVVIQIKAGVRWLRAWPCIALAIVPWLLGAWLVRVEWVAPGHAQAVALVQGNVDQSLKWNPGEQARIVETHRDLTNEAWDTGLVIWPEAAVTAFEHEVPQLLDELDAEATAADATLVFGIPWATRIPGGGVEYYNAVRVLGLGDDRYLKHHLVPFGEYVPLESWLRGLIAFFDLPMSGFSSGPKDVPPLDLGHGLRGAMAICYEIVYPELVRRSARNADVLLTVSNDTWFGRSIGPLQHLEMAQMRALENGRWLLRATNNGVTAIVDAKGVVRARLPQFEPGVLRGEWSVMTGLTPYARLGLLPVSVAGAGLLLLAFILRRRGIRAP